MDDSTGATIAEYAGQIFTGGYYTMALRFEGYDVPILYWSGGRSSSTALVPYTTYVYFSSSNCTGSAAIRAYAMESQGFGAFGYFASYNGESRVFASSGAVQSGATYYSYLDGATCMNVSNTDNYFILTDITGAQLPPATIPFGFTVRAS